MAILKVVKLTDAELAEYEHLTEVSDRASKAETDARQAVHAFRSGLYETYGVNKVNTTESAVNVGIVDGCAVFIKEHY